MKTKLKPDFSGYVTKAGLKCSDGRTIMPDAFKHQDGVQVPLVWQHGHSTPENVLGHAVLEAREDGVYGYGYFNDTPAGKNAKSLVQHGDIKSLSIYANQLVERAKQVFHGVIREASLVLSGANPGALIDFVAIQHADGSTTELEDAAVIYTGLELEHSEDGPSGEKDEEEEIEHADGETIKDVYDTLNDEQKNVVHYMIGTALAAAATETKHSATGESKEGETKEGTGEMKHNVFEQNGKKEGETHELTHDAIRGIVADAERRGSLKAAVEAYALQHGITDIDTLFPDAKLVDGGAPEWTKRRTEWVAGVLNGTRHSPFSRIKTRTADITGEQARALGYITGNLKKEEFFTLASRTTGPTTIYKKQKLDRDDMIDITDFDVVAWLKGEMRLMLEEEVARAILIGDGRPALVGDDPNPDKIKDPAGATAGDGIRSILHDHALYAHPVNVTMAADGDYNILAEELLRQRRHYKGSGNPTLYTTNQVMVEMLLSKDNDDNRRWKTKQELAAALMVKDIVEVEVMESSGDPMLLGIIVNLADYVVGADRGGDISMFDDFDIDYNQYKYLIETRVSGALTKLKSALVVKRVEPAP